ncbi:putative AAR2 protein [Seiridium cardinale]
MDPPGRSADSSTSSPFSSSLLRGAHHVPSIEIQSPQHLRSRHEAVDSPGLTSLKSVDSVPVTGVYPLGSLHINEPRDDEDVDMDLATPLTVPDRTPEPVDKDAELLTGGDALILDDLPSNFTVGCDTISFSTTQQFLGFRDIPSGAHLVWVSPLESTSSRSGYWLSTPKKDGNSPGKVYVKQWDKFNEILGDPASQAEERFQKERLGQIFAKLAPYQFKAPTSAVSPPGQAANVDPLPSFLSSTTIWQQLTSAIQPQLLDPLVTGQSGQKEAWAVNTSDRIVGETSLPEEARLYPTAAARLNFSFPMDQRLFDPSAEGSERTQQALDPTPWVLSRTEDENVLLGEVQFAFLTGMHLGNYSCLEQWWYYTTLIVFQSYHLAIERPGLALRLIQTFHAQLVYNERYLEGSSILDTVPENAKRLQKALTVYKSRLNEKLLSLGDKCTEEQRAVGEAFAAVESWLWRFGWDLRGDYVRSGKVMLEDGEVVDAELSDFESEDERGDYAAVVVDMDENGRPTDFVSV